MSKMILALAYKIFFELTKSLAPNIRQKKYLRIYPAGNYMFKVNNRDTRTRCEIFSKLTIKIPEQRQWQLWVGKFLLFIIRSYGLELATILS